MYGNHMMNEEEELILSSYNLRPARALACILSSQPIDSLLGATSKYRGRANAQMKLEYRGYTPEMECNSAVLRNAMQSSAAQGRAADYTTGRIHKQDGGNEAHFQERCMQCLHASFACKHSAPTFD